MIRKFRRGFTLIEILIVVAVLAIILSIAIPNLVSSSSKSKRATCVANLKKIDSAIDLWAMENQISGGTVISEAQENTIYASYIKGSKPVCPLGGHYSTHSVGVNPQVTCSREDAGHRLP